MKPGVAASGIRAAIKAAAPCGGAAPLITRELRKFDDHDLPKLGISRQCVLLGLHQHTRYYRPIPVRKSTLSIMAMIDALYLEDPCSGSRRMLDYLGRQGIPICRDRA